MKQLPGPSRPVLPFKKKRFVLSSGAGQGRLVLWRWSEDRIHSWLLTYCSGHLLGQISISAGNIGNELNCWAISSF
jgi:hypothetical protein